MQCRDINFSVEMDSGQNKIGFFFSMEMNAIITDSLSVSDPQYRVQVRAGPTIVVVLEERFVLVYLLSHELTPDGIVFQLLRGVGVKVRRK